MSATAHTQQPKTQQPRIGRAVLPSGLGLVQFVAAAVDGLVLSSITVHALVRLQVGAGTVGVVLAAAAVVAMVAAPTLGAIADRIGLPRAGAWYATLSAAALVTYAATPSLTGFAVAAAVFVTAQAASGSIRHAIAVAGVQGADRTRLRASMHTVLNAGFGCGAVVGVVVLASAVDAVFSTAYALAAVLSLITAGATLRLPAPDMSAQRPRTRGTWIALRDRPFAGAVALACLVQLTMPILSLLLPVWVLQSAAPTWTAGVALAVNTVLVIIVQRAWAAHLVDARTTALSALIAAGAMVTAGLILAALPHTHSPTTAVALVIAAVVVLTVGEVSGGAAVWQVALQHIDASAEGRYQSAFSMSASGARILGPLIALPLVLRAGSTGWVLLTVTMGAACLLVARRSLNTSTDPKTMRRSSSMTSFGAFLTARERTSTAFVEGDAGPLLAISVDTDPATIYPPTGAVVVGADAVNTGNAAGAETFGPGAENRFDILHSGSDGDLGYWTGIQHSTILLKDKPEPITMNLRITELFRRVDGEWKLFHRHADTLQQR